MATKKKPSGPAKRGSASHRDLLARQEAKARKRVGRTTKGTQMDPGRKAKQAALDKRKSGPPKKRTKKTPAPRRPY